jgi:hypothetical protein
MSETATAPAPVPRQPLGLPAGSVRAILSLLVMGQIYVLLLLPDEKAVGVPIYLYYLMFLVVGHYFAAHGHTIASPALGSASPLHLPRGTVRALIILGFIAVLAYRYYSTRNWDNLLKLQEPLLDRPYLPIILIGAFFLGHVLSHLLGGLVGRSAAGAYWLHDLRSWVALIAGIGLCAEVIIQLVINPSLDPGQRLKLPQWQAFLAAIVAFYFGARS